MKNKKEGEKVVLDNLATFGSNNHTACSDNPN